MLATSITHPGRQFTQADLRLAMALADRAALAIENSRLYAQERRLRQELEDLNQKVQEANRLKTEFVTVVTHELRSPLTSIAGYLDLLLEEEGLRGGGGPRGIPADRQTQRRSPAGVDQRFARYRAPRGREAGAEARAVGPGGPDPGGERGAAPPDRGQRTAPAPRSGCISAGRDR